MADPDQAPRKPYSKSDHTEEQWALAKAGFETEGLSYRALAERSGIPASTIRLYAMDQGWKHPNGGKAGRSIEELRAAAEAAKETSRLAYARRRDELCEAMVQDVFRLRDQVFEPVLRREVKTVSIGPGMTETEIVDVWLPEPPAGDKQKIITSMAILVDKVLLMSGEATARAESGPIPDREQAEARLRQIRDELGERRAAKEGEAEGPAEEEAV